MRRRFGSRKKRGASEGRAAPIDAERWMARIIEAGLVPVSSLEAMQSEGVDASYAALGKGEREDGTPVIVAFSPTSGGDAALAALAAATALGAAGSDDAFKGVAFAIAPYWSQTDVRRLGAFRETTFAFQTLAAPQLAEGPAGVPAELPAEPACLSSAQVAAHIIDPAGRALFLRAAASLEGLAAKHGGAIRGVGLAVELVLLGRRVAELRIDEGVVLNTILPQRASTRLSDDDLPEAFDRFEGQLRKRLNDRKARDGEEGMRTRVIPLLSQVRGLRGAISWPLGGADRDAIDVVGIDAEGYPVIGAIRAQLTLAEFGSIVDAGLALRLSLPLLFVEATPPVRLESPRLALAAQEFAASVASVLPLLALGHDLFEVRSDRSRGFELAAVTAGDAPPMRTRSEGAREDGRSRRPARDSGDRGRDGRGRRTGRGSRSPVGEEAEAASLGEGETQAQGDDGAPAPTSRGRGRSRGRSRRRGASEGALEEPAGAAESSDGEPDKGSRFDEMSSFDLDDDPRERESGDGEEAGARRKRRGRSRGRGGRGPRPGGDGDTDGSSDGNGARSESRKRPRRGGGDDDAAAVDPEAIDDEVEVDDLDEILAPLPDDVSDLQLGDRQEPSYEDDEEPDAVAEVAVAEVQPTPARVPRRRAAIVAHADRDSLIAAIMLARDLRLLEGVWVYPQSELMTFFRSVAIDLREGTPVYLIGFTPSPAGEVLPSAALFSERLTWFDHHEWPPEDLEAIRRITGDDGLMVTPGAGTSLPAVLEFCSRRSRFSDKLVDLATGRFTQHDFERWGRLWLTRLSRIADTPGERRSDIDALLAGRPSDLAKESALVETPPIPQEVEFVSTRDFRLVHFSGHSLVVLEVPPELDIYLASRIARERYDASLSLAIVMGGCRAVMGGSESKGRRSLNLTALVDHLDSKFGWVTALPDADHVARFQIADLDRYPERLDDVIGMIAMGRSIIER